MTINEKAISPSNHDKVLKGDAEILGLSQRAYYKNKFLKLFPYLGLIFIFFFSLIGTSGRFVASSNLSNLIEQSFTITVLAVGASFVYASGRMDISIGSVMALSEFVMGKLMLSGGVPLPLIIAAGIALAIVFELSIAVISTYLNVPSFIVSLSVMNICTGIVASAVAKKDLIIDFQKYSYFNMPAIRVGALILIIAAGLVVFYKMKLGRDLKAIGGNEVAAVQSGVHVGKSMLLAFATLGVCVGIAGFFSLTRVGIVTGITGQGMGLNVILAIILGGFPLAGGANSRMIGTIVGALTIVFLSNGLSLMGIDTSIILVVKGILFIIIVGISYERVNGKEIV